MFKFIVSGIAALALALGVATFGGSEPASAAVICSEEQAEVARAEYGTATNNRFVQVDGQFCLLPGELNIDTVYNQLGEPACNVNYRGPCIPASAVDAACATVPGAGVFIYTQNPNAFNVVAGYDRDTGIVSFSGQSPVLIPVGQHIVVLGSLIDGFVDEFGLDPDGDGIGCNHS